MKTLFLAAYFAGVARQFSDFAGETAGKKLVFIPTASLPEKVNFYVAADKKALTRLGLILDELEVSTASASEIADKIGAADFVFVEGGNTFFLLQELRRSGADKHIIGHIARGKPYVGASAGSMILAPNIEYARLMDDPAIAPQLGGDFSALAQVDFCVVPHFTNAPFKRAAEKIVAEYASTLDLRPISNHQAIVVRGGETRTVSAPAAAGRQKGDGASARKPA
ncbi:MAG: Type 1 glutamine amidotransferase-like domain-containing protein [Burkholderiaceae bacterium]|jgi:dipeptidase E|nr:Type 1 glutamine amidotransferase-like domain-containing protein [Burkholderiaceae bacterium]